MKTTTVLSHGTHHTGARSPTYWSVVKPRYYLVINTRDVRYPFSVSELAIASITGKWRRTFVLQRLRVGMRQAYFDHGGVFLAIMIEYVCRECTQLILGTRVFVNNFIERGNACRNQCPSSEPLSIY